MKLSSPRTMAYPVPRRRSAGLARYTLLAIIILTVMYYYRSGDTAAVTQPYGVTPPPHYTKPAVADTPQGPSPPAESKPQIPSASEEPPQPPADSTAEGFAHPIDALINSAGKTFDELLKKESHDIKSAADEYRKRRGRHPPPGFDQWFKFAQDNKAVMVEDFFDQIYHDLGPFWGVPANVMRKEAAAYDMTITVRDRNASAGSDWFWTQIWLNMTQTIEHLLPDMDIPLNAMDEPRILAPWEEVNVLMNRERETRNMPPPGEMIQEFSKLPPQADVDPGVKVRDKAWEQERPFWNLAIRGCAPDSLARRSARMSDFSGAPALSLSHAGQHLYHGFVSNFTLSNDYCHQPDIQGLHGMMMNPLSVSSTHVFSPMFGGSKLPTNNEILLPAPMYWNNEERFTGGDDHGDKWANKKNKVIWRGVATGGRNTESNWRGFQRHRFVAMTNATKVTGAESWEIIPPNFVLPPPQYSLAAQQENVLGAWMKGWSDTGFVDLNCNIPEKDGTCNYTSPHFEVISGVKMAAQFDAKYLPDIDGNSFSGRYRGFLMSTSLPIKATIFKEWHDSRLIPWKHFVPMDNRFLDFWGIMQYFIGYASKKTIIPGHDKEAEKIALEGQEWANRVLRREDMQIYTLRLLLEYARLSDDRRERMGWVSDLL